MNDILLDLGIEDFTILGNTVIVKSKFQPKNRTPIVKLDKVNMFFRFTSDVKSPNGVPSNTQLMTGRNISFKVYKETKIETIKDNTQLVVTGIDSKSSTLRVNNISTDRAQFRKLLVEDTDIKVGGELLLEEAVIKDSIVISNSLVLDESTLINTKLDTNQLMFCGTTKMNIEVKDTSNVVLMNRYEGVLELHNVKNLYLDLSSKYDTSKDFKITGSVEKLYVYNPRNIAILGAYMPLKDLKYKKWSDLNLGQIKNRARYVMYNKTIK